MPRQVGGDAVETSLGRWLHSQRGKIDKGTLTTGQRAALDAIGVWDSDRRERREHCVSGLRPMTGLTGCTLLAAYDGGQ